jgi:hypothetical protein
MEEQLRRVVNIMMRRCYLSLSLFFFFLIIRCYLSLINGWLQVYVLIILGFPLGLSVMIFKPRR